MNIFEQFGIKEVADVCLYSIQLDENDDEIYIPVLYMDTLKVSTVEEATQQTSAQGGIGNPKLITWDYGKDITVTLNDALCTPASMSMNWCGELGVKGLTLYLRYFFDRNTDNNTPNSCLRTAKLYANQFSDFLIIPDRYPVYENQNCEGILSEDRDYTGNTSIYCWMVSGFIISDDRKKKIKIKDLILFYREQTQKWYFFNGKDKIKNSQKIVGKYSTKFQYGKESFEWIKENIAKGTDYNEIEKVSQVTDGQDTNLGAYFLTQNLYIDGYRNGCEKTQIYCDDITWKEYNAFLNGTYIPYRYFANIGVEYNTNIAPPQDVLFQSQNGIKDVDLIEGIHKYEADKTFCIDTDVNMKHGQFRFLNKYSETELTVYLDPITMQPYQPNSYDYQTNNGKIIHGNLRIIKQGETYYKWDRKKSVKNRNVGKQLIIDCKHYPGTYKLVGETYKRDRYGADHHYQFEIPLCKLHADNKLTLQADGEPTIFTMKLTALRRYDGVMMKLTEYDIENDRIQSENAPDYNLYPTEWLDKQRYNEIDLDPAAGIDKVTRGD